MKLPKMNYHIHTIFSDGKNEPSDYVERAIAIKIDEIGFSDHLIILENLKPSKNSMEPRKLDLYIEEINEIKEEYKGKIEIKCGLEVDYIPQSFKYTLKLLNEYDFDFLILSVHRIGKFHIDSQKSRKIWKKLSLNEIRKVYSSYFKILQEGAKTGTFDIVAHFDIVKKFGYKPDSLPINQIEELIETINSYEMAVEINSAGLRHPVKEIYPAEEIISILIKYKTPLTLGTDAHILEHLNYGLDKIINILRKKHYSFSDKLKRNNLTIFSHPTK